MTVLEVDQVVIFHEDDPASPCAPARKEMVWPTLEATKDELKKFILGRGLDVEVGIFRSKTDLYYDIHAVREAKKVAWEEIQQCLPGYRQGFEVDFMVLRPTSTLHALRMFSSKYAPVNCNAGGCTGRTKADIYRDIATMLTKWAPWGEYKDIINARNLAMYWLGSRLKPSELSLRATMILASRREVRRKIATAITDAVGKDLGGYLMSYV